MKCQNIFIVENIPSLNKGEATIFEGMLESFKLLGPVHVAMMSPIIDIDELRYKDKVELIELPRYIYFLNKNNNIEKILKIITSLIFILKHLFFLFFYWVFGNYVLKIFRAKIWRKYIKSDIIIIGHDGVFGLGGAEGMPIFLYPVFISFFGKVLKKTVVLYGGSVTYPNKYPTFVNPLLKFGLKYMDLITLREDVSLNNCKKLGINMNVVHLTADLAYLMVPTIGRRIEEIMQIEKISQDFPIIGITVTYHKAVTAFPSYSKNDSYIMHNELFAEIIDEIIPLFDAQIVFIPHSIGFGRELDDRIIYKDIYKICHHKNKIKIIETEYNAEELKGLIGKFDLFIGERLHSTINAISMNIPTIIVSNFNDQRLNIIKLFGQEQSILFLNNLEREVFLNKIIEIYNNRDVIKKQLILQMENAHKRSMLNGILLKNVIENSQLSSHDSDNT